MGNSERQEKRIVYKRGVSCTITAFEIIDAPADPNVQTARWMAVATAQVFDPNIVVPPLTPAQTVLAGETMRVESGRGTANNEISAMVAALEGLLFQLTAKGYVTNHDVTT